MSNISFLERRKLERLFCMGGGYVLDFSNRTFSEFFADQVKIDIYAEIYGQQGTSKANRLRSFWDIADNYAVGKSIEGMIFYGQAEDCLCKDPDLRDLTDDCWKIAKKLLANTPVPELGALTANIDERDVEIIVQQVREAIEKNQPEGALDRLHTFIIKYSRSLCKARGILVTQSEPLHSVFGKYVKCMREAGYLESEMAARILKSSISVLEAFNDVRNHKSLAHDNPLLNYEESLLIFNHIASSIRFIKSLEDRLKLKDKTAMIEEEYPF